VYLGGTHTSRNHATIRKAQGRWFIQDEGSTTGTYVNGQRVTARELVDGDVIRIGDHTMVFHPG
jgi:pSer/pThr/pTyr-binding forkhead associated (FHA) protein